MKKTTLIISGLLLISIVSKSQSEVLAGWTFPGSSGVADTGILINLGQEITTTGETSAIDFKNGFDSKAAQATGWDEGMSIKGWVIPVNTTGYENLSISSRQQSGGNDPGPKFFHLQYSVDLGDTWVDIDGGDITVENDWETGYVDDLSLPVECNDQLELLLCWKMTSNEASGSGGEVLETGKSKIDEIYIKGEKTSRIQEQVIAGLKVYPNPVNDILYFDAKEQIARIRIVTLTGFTLLQEKIKSRSGRIWLEDLESGSFFIEFTAVNGKSNTRKILKL